MSAESTDDLAIGHAVIMAESNADDWGRQSFTMEWRESSDGRRRGQCFHASIPETAKRMEGLGYKVTIHAFNNNVRTA